MSPEKAGTSLAETPKWSTPQWIQNILAGAGLLAIGIWTANQCSSGWTGKNMLDYVKSTSSGDIMKPCSSTLTEPWSKVSDCAHSFRDSTHVLQVRVSKHN